MFIITLKFTEKRPEAANYLDAHNAWIKQGFEENLFLLVGRIEPKLGGGIIAHNTQLDTLTDFVNQDPFVEHGIVEASIQQWTPARTEERLSFLKNSA